MDVFDLDRALVADYAAFARSFTVIRADDIRSDVDRIYASGRFWPEPLLQLNPHYKPGGSIAELVRDGTLDEGCAAYFRDLSPARDDADRSLKLRRHQREAIAKAVDRRSFVVTTGTGSGKSLCYFIPIVDAAIRARRRGEGRRTRAVVIYPMNALANSQLGELGKFLNPVPGVPPVTFGRYTGQESGEERQRIKASPPDILLTNFMMLELLMTRQDELDQTVIANCRGLDFLVLDELHTYRGRQGADVAMLIRRVRERLEDLGSPIQCIGTSATMASEGLRHDRDAVVAEVASRLFATPVARDCVITETLRRVTDDTLTVEHVRAALGPAIDAGVPAGLSNAALAGHPLAVWVETRLGLAPSDDAGAWVRAQPRTLTEAAAWLAEDAGRPEAACRAVLQASLLEASRPEHERVAGGGPNALFAFKLHQFLAGAGRAYTTLDAPGSRRVTVDGQVFDPDAPEKRLYALYFCRRCGQEFHPVKLVSEAGTERVLARDIDDAPPPDDGPEAPDDKDGPRETDGFLMPEPPGEFAFLGRDEDYPEAWQEITRHGEIRLKARYRHRRAVLKTVETDGRLSGAGRRAWFLPGRFRFCPACGDYAIGAGRDINRLAGLTAEGRSSATTVLVSSIVRWMNGAGAPAILPHRRKVLGFTDNRQDAALQAGHFNDFVFVTQLRAAILAALDGAGSAGADEGTIGGAVQAALGFVRAREDRRSEWLQEPDLKGANLINAEADLRAVLLHRFWVDQRRGWRFTHPNLEELGFLRAGYLALDELARDEGEFAEAPPPLAAASPERRLAAYVILLDHLRKGLAIRTEALDRLRLEALKQRSERTHRAPWGFSRDERPRGATQLIMAAPARREIGLQDEALLLRGGSQSALGRRLRSPDLWGSRLSPSEYETVLTAMLAAAARYGLVSTGATPFGSDIEGWQLEGSVVRFHRQDPQGADRNGRAGPNPYFIGLYENLSRLQGAGAPGVIRLEGREHTAQVDATLRQIREERFRFEEDDVGKLAARGAQMRELGEDDRFLPVMFCSPTMELGVDIAALDAVYLRNVPPTPANYAQRSGRAGRGGQAALVVTYCAAQSPHDQYFFNDQRAMVHGVVRPPAIDLANQELVESHLNAIWLAATQAALEPGIAELLDLGHPERPVRQAIRAKLADPAAAGSASARIERFLAQLDGELTPVKAPWFGNAAELGHAAVEGALARFEASFDRWRDLFGAAERQLNEAHRITTDHSAGHRELQAAKERYRQAANQLDLLKSRSESPSSDFYTYRYLATEGFLPGYNFPRLPLMAYVPATQEGVRRQTFLQRARFLGLAEFGPRSLVYHEGRAFRVVKAMIPPSARGDGDGRLATRTIDVCRECGAAHESRSRESCHSCGAPLADADIVRDVFRIQNVETIPAERISINDEERQRQGFDLQTLFAWASRGRRIDVREALARDGEAELLRLSYGSGATITRLNKGLRRRRDQSDLGFVIDPRSGWWAKGDDEDEDADTGGAMRQKVVPAVEENKNALHLRPAAGLGPLSPEALTTLRHALLRGIETVFQLEQGEVLGEPLPSRDDRRAILLYEATEGGAGVLSRLATEPDALARVAREALRIMHYDPPDDLAGVDAEALPERVDIACAAGCYRCVLSYYNQPDHNAIDRRAADLRNALIRLARSVTTPVLRAAPAAAPGRPEPAALQRWRAAHAGAGLREPDAAPIPCDGGEIPLVWREACVAASLGPLPQAAREVLRAKGFDVVVFPEDETEWPASFERLSRYLGG